MNFALWFEANNIITAQAINKTPQGWSLYFSPQKQSGKVEQIKKTNNPNVYIVKSADNPQPYFVNIPAQLFKQEQKPASPWGETNQKIAQVLQNYPTFPYFWMDLKGNPIKKMPAPPIGMKPEYMDKTSDMAQKLSGSHRIAEYVYQFSLHPQNIKRRVLGWIGDTTNLADEFPVPEISKAIDIPIQLSRPMYQKMMGWLAQQPQQSYKS